MAAIDRFLPLNSLVATAEGSDRDLVLDRGWAEVDGHVIRRTQGFGNFLPVDKHCDAGVIESRSDGQVDDAVNDAFRLPVPAQEELGRASSGCCREQQGEKGNFSTTKN